MAWQSGVGGKPQTDYQFHGGEEIRKVKNTHHMRSTLYMHKLTDSPNIDLLITNVIFSGLFPNFEVEEMHPTFRFPIFAYDP